MKTVDGFRRLFFKLQPDAPGYGHYKFRLTNPDRPEDGAGIFSFDGTLLAMEFVKSAPDAAGGGSEEWKSRRGGFR